MRYSEDGGIQVISDKFFYEKQVEINHKLKIDHIVFERVVRKGKQVLYYYRNGDQIAEMGLDDDGVKTYAVYCARGAARKQPFTTFEEVVARECAEGRTPVS